MSEQGWYYARGVDDFPQFSDEKLNGYSGPFATEHDAWVHYMETGEAENTRLRAALAERDARLAAIADLAGVTGLETRAELAGVLDAVWEIALAREAKP